jgi:2-keto-4-pentenoate hydratase/2-oxohepta-3-ene-1,7-dioic acid hydratase in catechol pathway
MTTNDVSCRDLTWREDRPAIRSDWLAGKSFDSFAPMGPFFVPKQFVANHADLAIKLWVNGVLKQDGNSRDMVFCIEDQIAYGSRMVTLEPGDIFATGTPAGTGQERLEFLRPGDVVETEIQFCGRQRNKVIQGSEEYVGKR